MVGNRFVGKEDVAIVYEQELLGPRGQMVLDHYENRLRLGLSLLCRPPKHKEP